MKSMEHTNVGASFRIMGDRYDTAEISRELGITPTITWNMGDQIRNTGKEYKYTAWIFDIEPEETLDINDPLKKLESIFSPKSEILCRLKERYHLEYSIDLVIVIEKQSPPAIYLDSSSVHFAAAIDARFDMDTYVN